MTTLAQIKEAAKAAFNNIDSPEAIKSLTSLIRAYTKEITGSQHCINDGTSAAIGLQIAGAMSEVLSIPNPRPNSFKSYLLQLTERTEQELSAYNYGLNDDDIDSCVAITRLIFSNDFPNIRDLMTYVHGVVEARNRTERRFGY